MKDVHVQSDLMEAVPKLRRSDTETGFLAYCNISMVM